MKRINPYFSIITPTYNRATMLDMPIQSVLAQTFPNWELLIIDDGSTDDTSSTMKTYNDPRIRYMFQSHKGHSAARNMGLEHAKGEWTVYIDSDNELYPEYLETITTAIQKYADILFILPRSKRTRELYINGKLVEKKDDSFFVETMTTKDIVHKNVQFDVNGFAHAASIIRDGFRFDESIDCMEDWDFVMFLCEKYPDRFLYIPEILLHYHQRFGTDGLVSNQSYKQWADAFERIYQKHKNDRILQGQTWYPNRVEKYRTLEKELLYGGALKPYLRYFDYGNKKQ